MPYIDKVNIGGVEYDIQDSNLKRALDFSNNEQVKISDDLYGSHAVYIDFNIGRYAVNGYNLSIKSYAHSTAKYPAGAYLFPTPPAGIEYSIIQYVSDSAGTNVVSYRDTASTATIPDDCIISIRKQNGNDFTESDLQTIQGSWIVTKNRAETGTIISDHLITNGTFFMIGNSLYLATAQIAAGATITPGTNATKISLADALNTLKS